MDNHENNKDDETVNDVVVMHHETTNANHQYDCREEDDSTDRDEEEDDNEDDNQVVEEAHVDTSEDFEHIRNRHHREEDSDEDEDDHDDFPFRVIIVGSSIRDIPNKALKRCRTLTEVRVRQQRRRGVILRSIGDYAFMECTKLRRINRLLKQGGVIWLGSAAFMCCESIEGELVIPNSVVFIDCSCFSECISITSVIFEPSTTGTVVEIRNCAFIYCKELSSATLPPNLERIPRSCFNRCTALTNVPIPPTVVELGQHSFAGCTSLPLMNLPESVDGIGKEAFLNCTALTTVTIRTVSSDLRFGTNIFGGCTSLSTIRMYPWHWSKLLSAMNEDPTFLFQNFRNYHKTMFEASASLRRRRSIRRIIRENQDLKTRFQPVLQAKQTMIDAQQLEIEELKQQLAAMTMVRKRKKTSK